MKKIKAIISKNIQVHNHFEEYFKIIDTIEVNENVNPDICIESCKALVEGISKTILINLDNTRTLENVDKLDFPRIFKDALGCLINECENIEGDFINRFPALIEVLGEIRNKRGDISHGRAAPKLIFSSPKLASTVMNMTESMLEYILEHYFSLDLSENGKLRYDSKDLKAYNNWLDESVDFPIKKARYSQVLYENDYDEYETRYSDEFLKSSEDEEDIEVERGVESDSAESHQSEEDGQKSHEVEAAKDSSKDESENYTPPKITKEQADAWVKRVFGSKEEKPKEVRELVNKFDEQSFWTQQRREQLKFFARVWELKPVDLEQVINNFLFTGRRPLRDEVVEVMTSKPKLKEKARITDELAERIMAFASELNDAQSEE